MNDYDIRDSMARYARYLVKGDRPGGRAGAWDACSRFTSMILDQAWSHATAEAGRAFCVALVPVEDVADLHSWDRPKQQLCLMPAATDLKLGPSPDGEDSAIPLCERHSAYREWHGLTELGTRWANCYTCQQPRLMVDGEDFCTACVTDALRKRSRRLEVELREAKSAKAVFKAALATKVQPAIVYYIPDASGRVLRVGMTINWDNRKKHYRTVPWAAEIDWDGVHFSTWFQSEMDARKFEKREIERLDPPHNDHHRPRVKVGA